MTSNVFRTTQKIKWSAHDITSSRPHGTGLLSHSSEDVKYFNSDLATSQLILTG